MTMQMFATLDKAKSITQSIGVFNLGGGQAAVVALGRYRAWTELGAMNLLCIVHSSESYRICMYVNMRNRPTL